MSFFLNTEIVFIGKQCEHMVLYAKVYCKGRCILYSQLNKAILYNKSDPVNKNKEFGSYILPPALLSALPIKRNCWVKFRGAPNGNFGAETDRF